LNQSAIGDAHQLAHHSMHSFFVFCVKEMETKEKGYNRELSFCLFFRCDVFKKPNDVQRMEEEMTRQQFHTTKTPRKEATQVEIGSSTVIYHPSDLTLYHQHKQVSVYL
jgi:hypothetical protein